YHDYAVCLIDDKTVIACLQGERFSRKKHDNSFPIKSLNILREQFSLNDNDISAIVFYEKPILKMERIFSNLIAISPRGMEFAFKSIPLTVNRKIFVSEYIRKHIKGDYSIYYVPHHISHAASAFLPSEFEEAAFMINDGVGEWESSSYGICNHENITLTHGVHYPHSLGLLYSAFTYFCGFRVNSGEYKLMGLAPYGKPKYKDIILKNIIDYKNDGSYRLNLKYFDFHYGSRMCGKSMEKLLKLKIRKPEDDITNEYADLASSVQSVIEEILITMAIHIRKDTGMKNLVMGGGVALNCTANSKIIEQSGFENVFIQPASGDAGGALGSALYISHYVNKKKFSNIQQFSYLGTEYRNEQIEYILDEGGFKYCKLENPALKAAQLISKGNILGWFQGRMEYGPRALGSRSILGDPRDKEMQRKMNLSIKFRESFRPFAPSVMLDHVNEYFSGDYHTSYMLTVASLNKKHRLKDEHITHNFNVLSEKIADIPAVIHADFSSRIQTVSKEQNPLYYQLIDEFRKITGVPLVINTSFNVRGQPIVENPKHALTTFLNTKMDYLIIGDFLLFNNEQNVNREKWKIENLIMD
ncbi:hypothetical protein KAU15_03535, partial [candidate division WOR-3 bacterium]|nr:hypothetical protein [candidate division WOR-3 bacterium]